MENIIIQRLHSKAQLPSLAHPGDACYDLYAPCEGVLSVGSSSIIKLGLQLQLPFGWEAQIRGRSGLASKSIVAHPGTIDHLYRQEVGVILYNLSEQDYRYSAGDRIAQIAFRPVPQTQIIEGQVQPTDRGGFGSSGR